MADINLVALEKIREPQVYQHRALRIVGHNLDVVGIGQIDFAQVLCVVSAAGVQLAHQFVVNSHTRSACGTRLPAVGSNEYGK